MSTIVLGVLVCCARIIDVSIGTIRTINIVQGRTKIAFFLGFIESGMWLMVTSTVLYKVMQSPLLGVFYALGFSLGNVVGITIEKKLAMGHSVFRIISREKPKELADAIRKAGFAVTTFQGEGYKGDVTLLYVVVQRKELAKITKLVQEIEKDAFYIFETAGNMSKKHRRPFFEPTGWRAIFKKK